MKIHEIPEIEKEHEIEGELEDLPTGWKWVTIDGITENFDSERNPVSKSKRKDIQGDYPYYGASGIIDHLNDYILDGEYLLISEDGANLESRTKPIAFIVDGKFWPNNHVHVVKTKYGVPLDYLRLYIESRSIRDYLTGTAQLKLTQKNLNKIPLPIAPQKEQKRIITKIEELFSKLDSGVSELQKGRERLNQYRLSLLKAAFEGGLSKRSRTRNEWKVTRDFEECEDPPGILEIPPQWRWVKANSVIESLRNGIYKPKEYYNDDGIASLRMYNIEGGRIVWKDIKRMELTEEELKKFRLEPGDLLVNRVNSRELVGKAAAIPEGLEECVYESKNIRVKPTEDVRGEYLGHWFYLFRKRHFMSQVKQTVGQATVTQTQIKEMPIPLAPIAEQDEILEEIDRQESILSDIREQLDTNLIRAKRLRQSILKLAFEGDLVPQGPTEEPPTLDGRDTNLEPGEQATLSEVTSDGE